MLPVSTRTERLATLVAIVVGWLLILAYLLMLLANLISALQEGASGNLLARVFSFAGLGVENPWHGKSPFYAQWEIAAWGG